MQTSPTLVLHIILYVLLYGTSYHSYPIRTQIHNIRYIYMHTTIIVQVSNATTYYANSRIKDTKWQHIVCATFIILYYRCSTTIYYCWKGELKLARGSNFSNQIGSWGNQVGCCMFCFRWVKFGMTAVWCFQCSGSTAVIYVCVVCHDKG